MDDNETLNRRARLRELVRECFADKQIGLIRHIHERTGEMPNHGEMSVLTKDHSGKSFGDKKARRLTELIGLHRRWFDMPIGVHIRPEEWLLDWGGREENENVDHGGALKPLRRVPVVGEVKGGGDGYLEELAYPVGHGEGVIEWPTADRNAYALRVRGDSMFPRYRAGEFVIVEPSIEPPQGEDVVVCLADGRKMLKVLNWIRDGEVQLLSINNGFSPMTISLTEVDSIQYAAGRAPRSALKVL